MDNSDFAHLVHAMMSDTNTSKQQLCSLLNLQKEQIANALTGIDGMSMSLYFKIIRSLDYCMVLRPSSRICYRIYTYNDLIQLFQEIFPQSGTFRELTLQRFLYFVSDWSVNVEAHIYTPPRLTRLNKRKSNSIMKNSKNIAVNLHQEQTVSPNEANGISLLLERKRGRRFEGDFRCTRCGEPANKGMRYSTTEGLILLCYACRGKLKSVTRTSIIYNAVESSRKKY